MTFNTPVTFLFKSGRVDRLNSLRGPTEFFYGGLQLRNRGWNVAIREDSDLGMAPPLPLSGRLANIAAPLVGGLPLGMTMGLLRGKTRNRLCSYGTLVATTNGMGLALALGKSLGLTRASVLLLAMGLLPSKPNALQRRLYPAILQHIHLVTISRGEQLSMQRRLPGQPIHYIPFGVDQHYWTPQNKAQEGNYVLAIGNDPHRDWPTLIVGWGLDLPPLKIVTSLPVPNAPANVEIIRGDWRTQVLTDETVRELYRGAQFVVIPIRQTIQPSGQSACLQAMACGKAVVLSDIEGLWDRDLMVDGESVVLTPPGDPRALAEKVRMLASDPALASQIGHRARRVVEEHLNVDNMADALAALLEQIND